MSVTYGFYNSQNGDRKYSAEDFSKVFDGVIGEGVIAGYGNALAVSAAETKLSVIVGVGRAWFEHTWTHNDADLELGSAVITKPTSGYKRIDTVVVEVDKANRVNTIKVVKGTQVSSSSTPSSPALSKGANDKYQYPLADIHLNGSMTVITGDCVVDRRSFATILSVKVDDIFKQYESSFNAWFDSIRDALEDDAATDLLDRVETLKDSTNRAYQHRNIFRGASLGTSITTAQKNAIKNGTFDNIYVGDYWTFNGVVWRVVDIDYWYRGSGGGSQVNHHVLIMPDDPTITSIKADSTGYTRGGFANSQLAAYCIYSNQDDWEHMKGEPYVPAAIANSLTYMKEFLVDGTDENDGRPTSGNWYNTICSVPSEIMVYGTRVWSYGNNGSGTKPADGSSINPLFTNSPTQLSLFRLCPKYIFSGKSYWLRDIVSATQYAMVLGHSSANGGNANRAAASSSSHGIRPIFAISGN